MLPESVPPPPPPPPQEARPRIRSVERVTAGTAFFIDYNLLRGQRIGST
jgi:hypothetical protein